MDANTEQQPSKQSVVRQPYIEKEVMQPLARMIARRILAGGKGMVGISGNVQSRLKATEESLADNKESDH